MRLSHLKYTTIAGLPQESQPLPPLNFKSLITAVLDSQALLNYQALLPKTTLLLSIRLENPITLEFHLESRSTSKSALPELLIPQRAFRQLGVPPPPNLFLRPPEPHISLKCVRVVFPPLY